MKTYFLGMFIALSSHVGLAIENAETLQFQSETQTVSILKGDEGYEVELSITREGRMVKTDLGQDFSCSKAVFGDGSNPELIILNCERQLNSSTYLLFNVYPSAEDKTKFTLETELFDSSLGSLIFKKLGPDFSLVSTSI